MATKKPASGQMPMAGMPPMKPGKAKPVPTNELAAMLGMQDMKIPKPKKGK